MVVKKKGNEDDYYSSIVPEKQEQSSDGKKVPKIKIKSVIHKGASSEDKKAPNLVEPVVLKGGEEEKEGTKKRVKSKQQTPIVTFEKAPEIQKSKEPPKQTISPFEKTIKKEALPIKEKNDSSVTLPPSQWDQKTRDNRRIFFAPSPLHATLWKKEERKGEQKAWYGPGRDDSAKKKGNKEERGASIFDRSFKQKKAFRYTEQDVDDEKLFRRKNKALHAVKKEKQSEDIRQVLVDKTGQEVAVPEVISVKEFSDKIGVPVSRVISELMKNGMLANLNAKIDFDTCFLLWETFSITIVKEASEGVSVEALQSGNIAELLKNEDLTKCIQRSPIVSVMGHVDHGKTSILDYIRKTAIVSEEAGWITQKIGAYQVERNNHKITFLDTPGHEAFSIMRSRWAKLTDLAVIVVAADEGVKPQTIESINHAKEAGVPIIVAVNKMDKPGANLPFVKWQMAELGLQSEEWGGSTIIVPVSAHTGLGIEHLLDMIILSTEMMELKANPQRRAIATVIESRLDAKLGPVATVLVNTGTLEKGDCIVCAGASGRVRFLRDFKGKNVNEAGPSYPVLVSGLNWLAEGGDILQAVESAEIAGQKAKEFQIAKATRSIKSFESASLDMLMNRLKAGSLKQLKIVLKCDSQGSLEALKAALIKLSTDQTKVAIIHSWVGDINESDVLMAGNSQALLIAYNVGVVSNARNTLSNSKIEFIDKKVIYHIIEKVESIITGMIDTRYEEVELGVARAKAIFFTSKERMIIGCEVVSGKLENRAKVRVVREGHKVGVGEISNLKSGVLDVHEIAEGNDCGISFKGDVKIVIGDSFEAYKMVQKK